MQHTHTTQKKPLSLELYHGLWRAMIAKALVELAIPDLLVDDGQKTVTELAEATRTSPIKLARFLRAAASCQFIRQIDDEFTASEQTASMRVGQPTYYLVSHLLNNSTVAAWNRLSENLQEDAPAIDSILGMSLWEYLDATPQADENFNGAMTVLSASVNSLISQSYLNWFGLVVDVGGGQGTLVRSIIEDHPEVRGVIFDREQALPAQEKLGDRCTTKAGNFLKSVVPGGDIYVFKNVFHNWDNQATLKILKNVRRAAPNGKIIIAELLISEPLSFAVCGLDLDMMVENGGCQRTAGEFKHLLEQAGFSLLRVLPVGRSPYSLIEAQ